MSMHWKVLIYKEQTLRVLFGFYYRLILVLNYWKGEIIIWLANHGIHTQDPIQLGAVLVTRGLEETR